MTTTGLIHLIIGIAGIFLNIIVAIAIHRDKEMKNATFQFMVQLALSDVEFIVGLIAGPGALNVAGIVRHSSSLLSLYLWSLRLYWRFWLHRLSHFYAHCGI